MITTNSFQQTPKELFWVSLKYNAQKTLLIYLGFFIFLQIVALFLLDWNIKMYIHNIGTFFLYAFAYIIAVILLAFIFRYLNFRSPKNKIYFQPIHYEIDEKFIKAVRENGTGGSYSWSDIVKFKKMKDRYLLLISKMSAIHLPFSIFKSEKDLQKFEEILKGKELI